MRRHVLVSALAIAAVLLSASSSYGRPPEVVVDPATPGTDRAPAAVCTLEPAARSGSSYVFGAPDAFTSVYWRIPACAACGPGERLALGTATFRIRWWGICDAQAELSVVGSTGGAGCLVPDPTNVLCPPSVTTISGTGSVGVIHTISFSPSCCVPPDAFVRIRFIGFDTCYPVGSITPGITATVNPCVNCDQYFTSSVGYPGLTDWCSPGPSNSLWIQLASDCCSVTDVGESAPEGTGIAMLRNFSRPVRMAIRLEGVGSRSVDVGVFDVAGRRVATLLRGELEGGTRTLEWAGRAGSGARMRSGVYKVRLHDGPRIAIATVILID